MPLLTRTISTLAELEAYLNAALRLEHATIPPYLTALYSLHPGSNSDAQHVIRVVVVEEMLHLTLVANVMNALGLQVDLTPDDFTPNYPAHLPSGEIDFLVDIRPFSQAAVTTFLNIERPAKAPTEESRLLPCPDLGRGTVLAANPLDRACATTASVSSTTRSSAGCAICTGSRARTCSPATRPGR